VYLTIGNIEKSVRRKPSARASILIGYIPVSKLERFAKSKCQFAGYQLFHNCMRSLLDPLREAGTNGVDIVCADGFVRRAYPILSAYVADYPEQCLVACNNERRCPRCVAEYKRLGEPGQSVWRESGTVLQAMANAPKGEHSYLLLNQLGGVSMFNETYQNGPTSDPRSLPNPDKACCASCHALEPPAQRLVVSLEPLCISSHFSVRAHISVT